MKKVRKVVLTIVAMVMIVCTLTGCGSKVTMSKKQFDELMNQLVKLQELEEAMLEAGITPVIQREETSSVQETETSEASETSDTDNETSKTEETKAEVEPEEAPKAVITEKDYKNKEQDINVYEDSYTAMQKMPTKLNGAGSTTIIVFGDIAQILVASSAKDYNNFQTLNLATTDNIAGYYTVNFTADENIRYIFKVVTAKGGEYFFSIQTP